ncbi:MAG: hypothetical protein JSS82_00095 [Bacteroidetes bacterium]|nr:hypothetical protein [Bacteroidota bacterium]
MSTTDTFGPTAFVSELLKSILDIKKLVAFGIICIIVSVNIFYATTVHKTETPCVCPHTKNCTEAEVRTILESYVFNKNYGDHCEPILGFLFNRTTAYGVNEIDIRHTIRQLAEQNELLRHKQNVIDDLIQYNSNARFFIPSRLRRSLFDVQEIPSISEKTDPVKFEYDTYFGFDYDYDPNQIFRHVRGNGRVQIRRPVILSVKSIIYVLSDKDGSTVYCRLFRTSAQDLGNSLPIIEDMKKTFALPNSFNPINNTAIISLQSSFSVGPGDYIDVTCNFLDDIYGFILPGSFITLEARLKL